jgi:ankyrin repeat protein
MDEQLIYKAAERGDFKVIRDIVADDPSIVNTKNVNYCPGDTVLHAASEGGHAEIVEFLIQNGADVNIHDGSNNTPLYDALTASDFTEGHKRVAEILLSNGADINAYNGEERRYETALHSVAGWQMERVIFILNKGADINIRDYNGNTPLLNAVVSGKEDIVKFLLSKGAKKNIKNNHGYGPIEAALEFRRKDIADLIQQATGTGCVMVLASIVGGFVALFFLLF